MLIFSLALADQLELPIDNARKAGQPSYTRTNTSLIGDRGSYTNPGIADLDADGDYDMILGHETGLLEFWRNDGNSSRPVWTLANSNLIGDFSDRASPTLTDFDRDGDFDLFVGYSDGILRYFQNTGSPTSPVFTFVRGIINGGSYTMPAAVDYNNDGDTDIFYGRDNNFITALKNDVSQSGLEFRDFAIADVGSYSTAFLADIDLDGDFDAFVGDNDGNVRLFKNLGGTNASVFGTANKDFWDDGTILFDVGTRADPTLGDLDADGDLDLLIGKGDGTFAYYRNDGTARNFFWNLVAGFFTADAGDNAAPTLADLNGDGDFDLAVGNTAGFVSYYENQGTIYSPNFVLSGTNLVGDVGDYANPQFADLDMDGDSDLAVGKSDGIILYFNNTGNNVSFTFTAAVNVLNDYIDFATPAFADLDGDGDLDLATGSGDQGGWISLIENTGSPQSFVFSNSRTFWFDNAERGRNPDFADFDKDGDLDMVYGTEDGYVHYQRNDGSPAKPMWTYVRNFIGDFGSWTVPIFGDLNSDGRMDFILGRSDDNVFRYFRNDVEQSGFNFVQNTSDLVGGIGNNAIPEFADLDADGDLDLLMGGRDGRVRYFRNDGTNTTTVFAVQADPIGGQGRHTSLSTGDLDADGDLDFVLGNDNYFILYFRNDGNNTNFNFVLASSNFLNSFCVPGGYVFCNPELVDLDADNDLDMLASDYYGSTRFWRNDGTPNIPVWSDQGTIIGSIGNYVGNSIGDLDKDGDFDLLLTEYLGSLRYYENIGSTTSHQFTYIYAGPGGYGFLRNIGTFPNPEFVDLNADGNLDVAVGLESGLTALFNNMGHWTTDMEKGDNPTWIEQDNNLFDGQCEPTEGSGHCNGELVDIDNDGDLDLIGGNYYYPPRWWENVGTVQVYAFTARPQLVTDFGNFHDTTLGDFDKDGDLDMVIGYDVGTTRYFKNIGTKQSPSFVDIYRGSNGNTFFPDLGDYAKVAAVDINADGMSDLTLTETAVAATYNSDFYFLRNRGVLTDPVKKAADPTWIIERTVATIPDGRPYNKPSAADIDGDGLVDLIVGDDLERFFYFRNTGSLGNPTFVLQATVLDLPNSWGRPALLDYDGDGDFDFYSGNDQGFVNEITNNGNYSVAITVTLKNAGGSVIPNASVVFSDDSGVVCSNQTDSIGQVRCPLTFVGNKGKIAVSNAAAGTVNLGIFSPNSRGNTFMTLANPSSSFSIDLDRFVFQTFDNQNMPRSMRIKVSDDNVTVFSKLTANGSIDGFFPRRYLENRQEPFTQNRIQYDIILERNQDYASDLMLEGVFVPNEINFNGASSAEKLYKFMSTHQMSTDAEYKGFVIYPALTAQRNYNLTDSIPSNFTYTKEATASYVGKLSCSTPVNGTKFALDFASPGCEFLTTPVQTSGDWLKFEFKVKTPSLDQFIAEGLSSKDFSFPPAELTLIS